MELTDFRIFQLARLGNQKVKFVINITWAAPMWALIAEVLEIVWSHCLLSSESRLAPAII